MSISREVVRCAMEISRQKIGALCIQPPGEPTDEIQDTDFPAATSLGIFESNTVIVTVGTHMTV